MNSMWGFGSGAKLRHQPAPPIAERRPESIAGSSKVIEPIPGSLSRSSRHVWLGHQANSCSTCSHAHYTTYYI